jgi:hypothetical protein
MKIVTDNQVVSLLTLHTNSRAIFYPGVELIAGQTPDLDNGYRDLALALAHATNDGYTNVRDSAHDYETSGETVDWSYYATRGLANTLELVGGGAGCPQALPPYMNCTMPDFTGTPGPGSTQAQIDRFQGHPVRDAMWLNLIYAAQSAGHSQITGTAVPGATLKITKDFDLFTAPIATTDDRYGPTTPPLAVPTHLESSLTVPASGTFEWDVNPSVRPVPAYEADGVHTGPRGFFQESYTLTCTAPDGTLLATTKVLVDKGGVANITPCQSVGVGGSVPATLAITLGAQPTFGSFIPGVDKDYSASTTASIVSTAGDATLSVSDPGHLTNGEFALPSPLEVSLSKSTWNAPVVNDEVAVSFAQHISAGDALRTGTYSKTLTFTLSTTNP